MNKRRPARRKRLSSTQHRWADGQRSRLRPPPPEWSRAAARPAIAPMPPPALLPTTRMHPESRAPYIAPHPPCSVPYRIHTLPPSPFPPLDRGPLPRLAPPLLLLPRLVARDATQPAPPPLGHGNRTRNGHAARQAELKVERGEGGEGGRGGGEEVVSSGYRGSRLRGYAGGEAGWVGWGGWVVWHCGLCLGARCLKG